MSPLKAFGIKSLIYSGTENLIKHRVGTLTSLLPTALATGCTEVDPEPELLKVHNLALYFQGLCSLLPSFAKNFENQALIPSHGDSGEVLCPTKSAADRRSSLLELTKKWHSEAARQDVEQLILHLQEVVDVRIAYVKTWLTVNTERFPEGNADIRSLKRSFEESCDSLRSSVLLCRADCGSCRLPCLLIKHHEGATHDCGTSHQCLDRCEFMSEHEEPVPCGLP